MQKNSRITYVLLSFTLTWHFYLKVQENVLAFGSFMRRERAQINKFHLRNTIIKKMLRIIFKREEFSNIKFLYNIVWVFI